MIYQLPRLHPDDVQEIKEYLAAEIKAELRLLHTSDNTINEMMTFSVKQVADVLGKHPQTISDYCKKGIIKAAKSGKNWIITKQNLELYQNGEQK
ncbi:hypothetical protein Q765_03355 [Flavobacterium rivuli WB 3.3-2 = DSM 21788]|uniref:Helix-turn-helix domain-containing protein n=1 Tax=Flavobacterium rivuli WB 3.3-2 = DSM 21788 TaxID=1121895 RepID=A0A0A2M749_9FLAO|nr:helix-turn-helix domain-containing protein [Flavobacterium rivuli]KGO88104.1 hypothetical protein Q765_03355 [Flavobacterium rivuli WB 3.3-2 = DSM 21788]